MSSEERITAPFPSSFDRDLENARVLIEEPPWKDNPQKYRKVAEGILRRILSMDPENESAKLLLAKAEIQVPPAKAESPAPLAKAEAPPPLAKAEPPVPVVKVEAPLQLVKAEARVPRAAPPPPPQRPVTPTDL